ADVRRAFGAVITAAEAQPIRSLPVTKDFVGPAGAGGAVVRHTPADFQVKLLDEGNVGEDGDQQFAVDFFHIDKAAGIAARIDAESLIDKGTTLGRQGVVEELVVHLAIASTHGGAKLTGPQFEQTAPKVCLDDGLTELRPVLQICAYGFEAVFAEATSRNVEEVEAGGALASRSAETSGFLVALKIEPPTESRRGQHRLQAFERIDACLTGKSVRLAMVHERFPSPVGAGDRTFQAGGDVVGHHISEGLAVVGHQRSQLPRRVRIDAVVEQRLQLGRQELADNLIVGAAADGAGGPRELAAIKCSKARVGRIVSQNPRRRIDVRRPGTKPAERLAIENDR